MATNIKARRRLEDLFKVGVEIRFGKGPDDRPQGKVGPFEDECPPEEIPMWITPPNPLQREAALREANAKRARALVKAKRDHDSEEHLTILAFIADMEYETLVDYVLLGNASNRRTEAEREILALDEWKDMLAYQDAMRQFTEMDPAELEGNEEWEALLALDDKYGDQLEKRERELAEAERSVLRMLDREKLEAKALDRRAELIGSQAFMDEYERQNAFYSIRDPENHGNLYYESVDELYASDPRIMQTVNEAMEPFLREQVEAKNSSGAADSSESSPLPSEPETSAVSTPEVPTE